MSLFGNMLTGSLDNYPRTIKALREYMAAEAEMWHEFEEMNERAMRDAIKMFAPVDTPHP